MSLKKEIKDCKSIIMALKAGLIPSSDGIEKIVVGREPILHQIKSDLNDISNAHSGFKFFLGDYGSGKTFMCSLARNEAWKENIVVSYVNVDPREVPMNKMETIYSKIINGIRTKDHKNIPAFDYILQEWLFKIEKSVQKEKGLDSFDPEQRQKLNAYVIEAIDEKFENIKYIDSSFSNALRGYYEAVQREDKEIEISALAWLKGEGDIPTTIKRQFNVKGDINRDNAINFLRALTQLITNIGYSGMLIIFDEIELIRRIVRQDLRNTAYENIRHICELAAKEELANTYFIFAGTEDVYTDEIKGIASYQALYDRIKSSDIFLKGKTRDMRAPIIYLDSFNEEHLMEVSHKIIDIHEIAYEWDSREIITNDIIKNLINVVANKFGRVSSVPRGYLKSLVDLLDIVQQNSDFNPMDEFINGNGFNSTIPEFKDIERKTANLLG